MKWFIVIALLFSSAYAQTQSIDITGNLVNNTQTATTITSTWQNAKFVNSLTCWQAGDPDCSAGQPYLRPDGNINFSYAYTELYQIVNVSKALPNNGSGLVTTGFTFSWRSKNGNGWDDGRLDQLTAYVQGYTKSGKWIENFGYNLNFTHDWTDFTWSQDWSKLRRSDELANVLFGFTGKDNNYWMGPYGPEITNVNFRLRYKPDPCVNNQLYSPECPKFQETLAKNADTYTVDNSTIKPTTIEYISDSTTGGTKLSKNSEETWQEGRDQGFDEQHFLDGTDRLIDTLFKIQDNQQREQSIAIDTATAAVNEADKTGQQTLRQAEQIASRSIKQSFDLNQSVQQQFQSESKQKDNKAEQSIALFQSSTSTQQNLFQPNFTQQFNLLQLPGVTNSQQNTSQTVEAPKSSNSVVVNNAQQTAVSQQNSISPTINQQIQQQTTNTSSNINQLTLINNTPTQNIEIPQLQQNFLTNKTDPINQILETKPQTSDNNSQSSLQQLKSNQPDNDLATGVPITQLAVAPTGYNQYLNFVLQDAAFYPSKEVYRNQRTVDNARALRQLSSDRLHQQMIDQQYGGSRE